MKSNNLLTETGKAVNLLTKAGSNNRSIFLVRAPFLQGALMLERAFSAPFWLHCSKAHRYLPAKDTEYKFTDKIKKCWGSDNLHTLPC